MRGRAKALLVGAGAAIGVVAIALAIALAGRDDSLERALAYVPPDSASVAIVKTDLGDRQYDAFSGTLGKGLLEPELRSIREEAEDWGEEAPDGPGPTPGPAPRSLIPFPPFEENLVERAARLFFAFGAGEDGDGEEIDYDRDVKPLLGGDLVIASAQPGRLIDEGAVTVALEVGDPAAAERVLRAGGTESAGGYRGASLYEDGFVIDGDVVVYAEPLPLPEEEDVTIEELHRLDQEGFEELERKEEEHRRRQLEAVVDRARDGGGMDVETIEAALDGTPDDAAVRLYADPRAYLEIPDLAPLGQLPWVAAMRSVAATASFERREVRLDLRVATDPDGLEDADLPLAPAGGEEPALTDLPGEVASATLDQSQTTAFLIEAARLALADSRFVRDVEAVERDLGIDFERQVLRQFQGPSASSLAVEGDFAARSTVRDPEALRRLLPRLAPRLPELVRSLEGLNRPGLLALLLFAPDAPVSTEELRAAGVRHHGGDLYSIEGPEAPPEFQLGPLPDRIVFGLIGDVFVVASDPERAREIATAPAEPAGLEGASAMRFTDLGEQRRAIERLLGFDPGPVSDAEGEMNADREELRASLRVGYE